MEQIIKNFNIGDTVYTHGKLLEGYPVIEAKIKDDKSQLGLYIIESVIDGKFYEAQRANYQLYSKENEYVKPNIYLSSAVFGGENFTLKNLSKEELIILWEKLQ